MKVLLFVLLLAALSSTVFSQVVAVQTVRTQEVILCGHNQLIAAVEGYPPGSISLSTNNGRITKGEDPGHYNFEPQSVGRATVYVWVEEENSSKRLLDSVRFNVERRAVSGSLFAGKVGGRLSHRIVVQQLGLFAPIEYTHFGNHPIRSFAVVVYRNDQVIFNSNIQGPRFDSTTLSFFYTLKNNDKLRFENITLMDCDGVMRQLEPIEFLIKEAFKFTGAKLTNYMTLDPLTGQIIHVK